MEKNRLVYEVPRTHMCMVNAGCLLCGSGNTDNMIIMDTQDGDSSFE